MPMPKALVATTTSSAPSDERRAAPRRARRPRQAGVVGGGAPAAGGAAAPPPPRRPCASARRRWPRPGPRPGAPSASASSASTCRSRSRSAARPRRARSARFGRREAAHDLRRVGGRPSRARISSRTTGVAVAVQASTRGGGSSASSSPICRYSGRKSWPHSLMQWASSIATSGGASSREQRAEAGVGEPLGRDVDELVAPRRRMRAQRAGASRRRRASRRGTWPRTPRASSACTWSCISAISGEMTSVVPGSSARRQLVDQALAAAGRRDQQQAPVLEQRLDRLALAGPERRRSRAARGAVEVEHRSHRRIIPAGVDAAGPAFGGGRVENAGTRRMRLRLAAVLLLLGALRAAAQGETDAFAPALPDGIEDVSRWQIMTGDFDTLGARGEYRLYVNPARSAMYQLMRYRVRAPRGRNDRRAGTRGRRARGLRPAPRIPQPMALWERAPPEPARPGSRSQPGPTRTTWRWESLMRVLGIHRAARSTEAP